MQYSCFVNRIQDINTAQRWLTNHSENVWEREWEIKKCIHEETAKIKFKECLIIYGPEYFVCTIIVQIYKEVLCGCEEWSLTLREGHRLGVFQKRLLRKIFGP
jgi:hypothetical protein